MNWSELLEEHRQQRKMLEDMSTECDDDDDSFLWKALLERARPHFSMVHSVISQYLQCLNRQESYKAMLYDTRSALRFAISSLSMPAGVVRALAQDWFFLSSHVDGCDADFCLPGILVHRSGDSKCRLLSARLLCNLVTSNIRSSQVVSEKIVLSPSTEAVAARLRESVLFEQQHANTASPNWVDAMLCASGNRQALGAVVAALYNSMLSLQPDHAAFSSFAEQVASCPLLVSTLLRQAISAKSITERGDEKQEVERRDEATEWIALLLVKLCRQGHLRNLHRAIAGDDKALSRVLPEQAILLHCIESEVGRTVSTSAADDDSIFGRCAVLGGEGGAKGIEATHLFLARTVSALLTTQRAEATPSHPEARFVPTDREKELKDSAVLVILGILAETLGEDSTAAVRTRNMLGHRSVLVPELCKELSWLHGNLSLRNSGRKSRDVFVNDDEQERLVAVVRLLGNLVFACPYNQDLVRTTVMEGDHRTTGLHVLLSCTAYSHACFSLREWAVVAIRNVLHENLANQQVVASLEAQQAVQSTELGDMGINVVLKDGRVSVASMDRDDSVKKESSPGEKMGD
jgi:hypothetical protein